jgi:hypothetical protein
MRHAGQKAVTAEQYLRHTYKFHLSQYRIYIEIGKRYRAACSLKEAKRIRWVMKRTGAIMAYNELLPTWR